VPDGGVQLGAALADRVQPLRVGAMVLPLVALLSWFRINSRHRARVIDNPAGLPTGRSEPPVPAPT